MADNNPDSPERRGRTGRDALGALPSSTRENLDVLADFKNQEDAQMSGAQSLIEKISNFFGNPVYFAFVLAFIVVWVLINVWALHTGWRHVDEPPFPALQGLVSSNALLLTIAVLIRQNRMARLAEHRSHVDLQVNLLTEQKVTKILQLVDELQRELTQIRHRPDVAELSKPADAHALMHAIKEKQGNI